MVPVAAVCFGYDHDNINPPTVAPARGATDDTLVVDDIFTASIHAPARGATVALFYLCPAMIFRAFFEQATYLDQFMQ